jgi:hypothetical protein
MRLTLERWSKNKNVLKDSIFRVILYFIEGYRGFVAVPIQSVILLTFGLYFFLAAVFPCS